jgi:outer membrane immunogenic protein
MKRMFIGLVAAAALGVATGETALAADMPLKAPPLPAPVANWSGFYIGGNLGGYDSSQNGGTTAVPDPGFGAPAVLGAGLAGFGILPTTHNLGASGLLGGIHGGYNWQIAKWVIGLEGDYSFLNRSDSDNQPLFATWPGVPTLLNNASMQLTTSNHWLASARGRLGWTGDNWMIYGTGGAAFTQTSYGAALNPGTVGGVTNLPGSGVLPSSIAFSQDKVGVVAGAGAEWMLSPHVLFRLEYLYYRFDGAAGGLPVTLAAGSPACTNCGWNVNWSELQFQTFRAGLSYKF